MDSVSRRDAVSMSSAHSRSVHNWKNFISYLRTLLQTMSSTGSFTSASAVDELMNRDRLEIILDFQDYPQQDSKLKTVLLADPTYNRYMMYAPRVMSELTKLLKVSEVSEFNYESGINMLVWMTTTLDEIKAVLKGKKRNSDLFEGKFLFPSGPQALMHNAMHQ
eukprot:5181870-Amphidinium_carterae.1